MTMAITKAVEDGAKAVVCASTGNTSASAAAYAPEPGDMRGADPRGEIAMGKLAQALIHGAKVLQIAATSTRRSNRPDSASPPDHSGQLYQSVSHRRPEDLCLRDRRRPGRRTRRPCIPVGNAGNITSYWRGYSEYHASGRPRAGDRT